MSPGLREVLEQIETRLRAFKCSLCSGHDEHTSREQPDLAEIIHDILFEDSQLTAKVKGR